MSNTKTTAILTISLITTLALNGCASAPPEIDEIEQPQEEIQEKDYATIEETMEVLGVPASFVITLPNGYKTSVSVEPLLEAIARLYMEPMRVWIRTEDGSLVEQHITRFTYEEAMNRVLKEADKNKNPDKIITKMEANNLLKKVYRERGRYY